MSQMHRRTFLKASAAASTAFSTFLIAGTKASGRVIGANDTINVAVAGIRGRGGSHISSFAGMDKVRVTWLVDVDSTTFAPRVKDVEGRAGNTPKCVQDLRDALDDKNLDAVSIATTNHSHSLLTIWSCQAGKDVYVEKPCSHNVFEGRKCVEAARKYGRVVQHGTQQRSSGGRAAQMAAIQAGKYGKLLVSKGFCCKPRWSIGFRDPEDPPATLNWNLWVGPAPMQPFHRNLVHYNWHWFWDFGNGDTGNQGVHEIDVARWATGGTLPKSVWSLGGRFGYEDQGQTPNTQLTVFDYGESIVLFETRGLVGKNDVPPIVDNWFYTTEGLIRGGKFYPREGGKEYDVTFETPKVTPGGPFGSFIESMRSRKMDEVNGDIEEGHYSSALCHLANISYRLGEPVPFNQVAGRIGSNPQVVESFETIRQNLLAVGVNLNETICNVGPELKFDPQTERFVDNDAANALLTRPYREPFVVPEKV